MENSEISAASNLEGKECGSLDRFHSSEEQVAFVTIQAIYSDWPPANRFWRTFQIFDPAGIFGAGLRTPRVASRYVDDLKIALNHPASNDMEDGEQRKVAACASMANDLYPLNAKHLSPDTRHMGAEFLIDMIRKPGVFFHELSEHDGSTAAVAACIAQGYALARRSKNSSLPNLS